MRPVRPEKPGPGPSGRSTRPGPSAPNFANFGTWGPCWAAEARTGMHDSQSPRLAIQVVFSPGSPLGPQSPAPFPLPPLKPTPSPAREARRGPGVRVQLRLRPRASPRPSSHLRPSAPQPPSSPRRRPGSFVALARWALWNARASRSQARPPCAEAGGGTGRRRRGEMGRGGERGGAQASASPAPGGARTRGIW